MRFVALLAALFLIPIAAALGWAAHASQLEGLVEVGAETHYGWVVTSGPYAGQTTDPEYVLTTREADRPPAEFKRITCVGYTDNPVLPALASRVARVCHAEVVDEDVVRKALGRSNSP